MRRGFVCVVLLLLSGCASAPAPPTQSTRTGPIEDFTIDRWAPNSAAGESFYLRDPDVLGVRAAGLRVLNITANSTFRLSNAVLAGTGNVVRWIAAVPAGAWQNKTGGCAAWDPSWRMRHFLSGVDTLTNQPLAAGNWSVIVHSEKLTNLTLLFNTTTMGAYRVQNGSTMPWTVQYLDADPKIESNNSPYRVTFNKTFSTTNRSWVVAHFSVRGDGFTQFREVRSKVEASSGFLCGEHRNEVAQPVTGGVVWNSVLGVRLGSGGSFSYAGRFESTAALNARPLARAEVVLLD